MIRIHIIHTVSLVTQLTVVHYTFYFLQSKLVCIPRIDSCVHTAHTSAATQTMDNHPLCILLKNNNREMYPGGLEQAALVIGQGALLTD